MKKYLGLILLGLTVAGCKGTPSANTDARFEKPVFVKPEVPMMMTDRQAQADFMLEHYWDKFDFSDTLFLAYPDILEQALVDYFVMLPYGSADIPAQSIAGMITQSRADTTMFRFFVDQATHYLWDPNSPYRNEELFIPVLETMLASDGWLDVAARARAEYRLEMAKRNRVGTTAANFTYTLESGKKGKMADIRSEYLLLFFNNPGCTACSEIIAHANQSPVVNALLRDERLTVLAVYPDQDLSEWEKYLDKMPVDWINSYDPETVIKDNDIYDLKAIPTLYLLDRDKTVLFKDAEIHIIERFLAQHALN